MPKHKALPPVELLQEHLHYDPDTGRLTWVKPTSRRMKPGDEAGTLSKGYRQVHFNSDLHRAHRLAWLMHHGVDPGEMLVDHRDGNKANNRISNLRLATKPENTRNGRCHSDTASGVKGVSRDHGRWRAQISDGTTNTHIGTFPTIEEATAAVRAARERLHGEFTHHGEPASSC